MNTHTTIIIIVITVITKVTEGAITCTAVSTRYDSTVTCSFGENISVSKRNFNVQFYYPDITATSETVLMCNWVTAGELTCKEGKDVKFDNIVSDKVIIKGPPAHGRLGIYVCQVVPKIDAAVIPCNTTYMDVTTTNRPITENPLENYQELEEIRQTANTALTVSAISLAVLVLVVILIVIFIIVFRENITQKVREIRGQGQSHKTTEDPEKMASDEGIAMTMVDKSTSPLLTHGDNEMANKSFAEEDHKVIQPPPKKSFFERAFSGNRSSSGSGGSKTDKKDKQTAGRTEIGDTTNERHGSQLGKEPSSAKEWQTTQQRQPTEQQRRPQQPERQPQHSYPQPQAQPLLPAANAASAQPAHVESTVHRSESKKEKKEREKREKKEKEEREKQQKEDEKARKKKEEEERKEAEKATRKSK